MQFSITKHLAIASAALAGILVTFALAWFFYPRAVFDPEDFLPADRTLILLSPINRSLTVPFSAHLPLLEEILQHREGASAALVQLNATDTAWIFFEPAEHPGIDRPVIRASVPSAMSLLATVPNPLSKDPDFRALRRTVQYQSRGWMYLHPDVFETSKRKMLQSPVRPLLLSLKNDNLNIAILQPEKKSSRHLQGDPTIASPRPFFFLQAADLQSLFDATNALLKQDASLVAGSLLKQGVQDFFGSSISARYALLPLLAEESTVQIAKTGSGLLIALQGSTNDKKALEHTLDQLHAGHRSSITTTRNTSRVLDTQYTYTGIAAEDGSIKETTSTISMWTVRTTSGFSSAQRGTQFVLSNDPAMLQSIISAVPGRVPPEAADASARGWIERDAVDNLLTQHIPALWGNGLPWSGSGGIVSWMLEEQGELKVLVIR